ncbi:MAG: 4Fe-4S binding protein [Syntrophomonas sp.]
MKRNIVKIDRDKCDGCGLCIQACHEGALQLVDGKAELITESYCDGLGACLPECPQDAITLEERDAADFDEAAVKSHIEKSKVQAIPGTLECGCAGSHARTIERPQAIQGIKLPAAPLLTSQLRQWPCQIKLVPFNAPYLDNAHLLIAADCTAFAYANIHQEFMRNKITLIGCPKLDEGDYSEKLTQILRGHEIKSVTVLRMEVPCCGGIAEAVKRALVGSGKMIPWQVVTINTDGSIRED